jgi:PKD domain
MRLACQPGDRLRRALVLSLLVTVAFVLLARSAHAVVLPAVTIDGPSPEIVGFGGVAMAEDGTGGLVYLKRVGGVTHVFVSRYLDGQWQAPIRVDTEQPFAASWPRIGAADGGELMVVWVTPFATEEEHPVDELLSATLGPGATGFSPATIVDPDVGEGTGTSPDLAMSTTGQADVVYRVVDRNGAATSVHAGDVSESVRVAHFEGERWADVGAINRDPGIAMNPPNEANAPVIAIGPTGNGVVVWQEPEITGVARIFARRLFGASVDYVMPVSATSFNGAPIEEEAEAPSVAFSRLGQAEVAYRQPAGLGSPLPGPRIFMNILPDGESANGGEFQGAVVADASVPGGKEAKIGRPSIDIDEDRDVRLLYDAGGKARVVEGTDVGLTGTLTLGSPFAAPKPYQAWELPSASVMNPEGGGVSAWPSEEPRGAPAVGVREDFPGGGVQTGLLSGAGGGPIVQLGVGRSGLGDGLVAFQQGALGGAAIVAATISAPPEKFIVNVPKGWLKPAQAQISWEPASSADGPLRYAVVLDGHELPTPAGALAYTFKPEELGSGVHEVQLLATDQDGAQTLTPPTQMRIDAQPPTVKIARAEGDRGVVIRVSDMLSGLDTHAVTVTFGDGKRAHGKKLFRHRYAHPGIYTIVVHVRDNLGNAGVVRRLVSVR